MIQRDVTLTYGCCVKRKVNVVTKCNKSTGDRYTKLHTNSGPLAQKRLLNRVCVHRAKLSTVLLKYIDIAHFTQETNLYDHKIP